MVLQSSVLSRKFNEPTPWYISAVVDPYPIIPTGLDESVSSIPCHFLQCFYCIPQSSHLPYSCLWRLSRNRSTINATTNTLPERSRKDLQKRLYENGRIRKFIADNSRFKMQLEFFWKLNRELSAINIRILPFS